MAPGLLEQFDLLGRMEVVEPPAGDELRAADLERRAAVSETQAVQFAGVVDRSPVDAVEYLGHA